MIIHRGNFGQSRRRHRTNMPSFIPSCSISSIVEMRRGSIFININGLSTLRRRRTSKLSRTDLLVLDLEAFITNLIYLEGKQCSGRKKKK